MLVRCNEITQEASRRQVFGSTFSILMISRLLAAALTYACLLPLLFLQVAAAANVSITVSPSTGVDSPSCSTSPPCKTITHAVQVRGATIVSLDSGIFNESTIAVSSVPSLSITGVSISTVFDCGKRDNGSALSGPALIITNSSVSITGQRLPCTLLASMPVWSHACRCHVSKLLQFLRVGWRWRSPRCILEQHHGQRLPFPQQHGSNWRRNRHHGRLAACLGLLVPRQYCNLPECVSNPNRLFSMGWRYRYR